MSKWVTLKAQLLVELLVPGTVHVDLDEFAEWSNGAEPTEENLREFIEADRDWAENSEFAWADSRTHEIWDSSLYSVEPPKFAESGGGAAYGTADYPEERG